MKRYSKQFERDYKFYLRVTDTFDFCGHDNFTNKEGKPLIIFDDSGKEAKYCFYKYDSEGKIINTCEPDRLKELHRTKASVNWHIKQWAQGRAECTFPKIEFYRYARKMRFPLWVLRAVERQKWKYGPNYP